MLKEKAIIYLLFSILMLLALNAFGGGLYGMLGAKDVSLVLLKGSPFENYFIPSAILFFIIGGVALTSSILIFIRHPMGRNAGYLTGVVTLLWISIQVSIIGYISFLQPVVAIIGFLIIYLTKLMPKYNA